MDSKIWTKELKNYIYLKLLRNILTHTKFITCIIYRICLLNEKIYFIISQRLLLKSIFTEFLIHMYLEKTLKIWIFCGIGSNYGNGTQYILRWKHIVPFTEVGWLLWWLLYQYCRSDSLRAQWKWNNHQNDLSVSMYALARTQTWKKFLEYFGYITSPTLDTRRSGDTRNQDISSSYIDLVFLDYKSLSSKRVNWWLLIFGLIFGVFPYLYLIIIVGRLFTIMALVL